MKKVYKQPVVRCIDIDITEMIAWSINSNGENATIPTDKTEEEVTNTEFDTRRQNSWNEW